MCFLKYEVETKVFSTNVKTTSDLMSIALQAEREAIRRYSELTTDMHKAKNESAAALFQRMVIEEQEHERLLLEWMAQEGIDENPEIAPVKWRDPNISTTYDDEARDPYQSSPYRALAFAVHNEEIAFRFYTHVAAESETEAVRKYAEILAREELGHAALLRAERRRAYHAERKNNKPEPTLDARIIHNKDDLLTVAIHIDRYLLGLMIRVAEDTVLTEQSVELSIKSLISDTLQQISNNEKNRHTASTISEDTASMLEKLESYNVDLDKQVNDPDSEIKRLWSCCDRSFAFYDAIVETTADENIMLTAQKLTVSALDRIGILKQAFTRSSTVAIDELGNL